MPLRRIVYPVFVMVPGPADPGYGVEAPVDPGYGHPAWGPVDPGYGVGRPPVDPGYGIPSFPHPGTGPIKPPGRPIVPSNPIYKPPPGHPWLPGHWAPVDPGYGLPPVFGWFPVDPGFGIPEAPPPTAGNLPTMPGHWVPTDPDYGIPAHECHCDKPHPPLWAWIPEIGKDFGTLPAPAPAPK
jgi:hypothetical protein